MNQVKLFMVLLGCKPAGRHTEQHDIFFSIGCSLKDLLPAMLDFWPEAKGRIHIDAWREVNCISGHAIHIVPRVDTMGLFDVEAGTAIKNKLYFLNLGGYKKDEFEEYHYKVLAVSPDKGTAIREAKKTAFYKHVGFKGATSHVDDKYGIDMDDIYELEDILPREIREKYRIRIEPIDSGNEDPMHLGYLKTSLLV
jgi:hypothetical protein